MYKKRLLLLASYCLISLSTAYGHESESQLPFARPHAHSELEGHVHVGWESRYFSEGRDALDGDSLYTSSFELGWKHLSAGVWYGHSPDQNYNELQLSLGLSHCIGDFEFYIAYTHFQFPFEHTHDNEIGIGCAWTGLPLDIELAADVYYSFEADGYFAEISAARDFSITDKLTLNLSGIFGINQGYVGDGHDGANHFALSLGLEYEIYDGVAITAHTAYSWEIGSGKRYPGDGQLIDFIHSGIGLQWSF